MLNIVIPMAGRGSRFAKAGYTEPKPLIPIHNKPMIEVVINNLTPSQKHRFIFLVQIEHLSKYNLASMLEELSPNCEIINVDQITEGAACTVLLATKFIDNDDSLMIANCDQWIDIDINEYLNDQFNCDGMIMTMTDDDPKWSFVGLSEDGFVNAVKEKDPISNEATVGIYNFSKGNDFVQAATSMIDNKLKVNGEYYVAPVYEQLISRGAQIKFYNIGFVNDGMYGLGTPDDLEHFLKKKVSYNAATL